MITALNKRIYVWRLALLPIAFFLLGTAWAFASPLGSAADDDFHLASIWCAWGPSELCQTLEDEFLEESFTVVPEVIRESTCYVYSGSIKRPTDAGCLDDYDTSLVVASRVASDIQTRLNYSPGFYPVMRVFAGQDIQLSVQVMRIFNVLLASLLLAAALWVATEPVRRAIGYSWGLLISPIGVFFIASTNPSSWAITGIGLSWVFAWTALAATRSRKVRFVAVVGLLVSVILATAARLDSLAFIAVAIIGVFLARAGKLMRRHRPFVGLGLIAFIALATYVITRRWGQSFSFIGAHTGTDMPSPLVKTVLEIPSILFAFVGGQRPTFVMSESPGFRSVEGYRALGMSFGHGWTENVLPSMVGLILGCLAFFLILTGVSFASWWRRAGVLSVVLAVPVVVILAQASEAYRGTPIQPRYLFGLFIVAAGLALVERRRGRKLFSRFQLAALGTFAWLATSVAWLQTSSRYAIGPEATFTNFGQQPGWWWGGPFPGRLASTVIVALITALWIAVALLTTGSTKLEPEESTHKRH